MDERRYLKAYLRAQDAHRAVHKLTKAFETDASDEEIQRQLGETMRHLNMVHSFMMEAKKNVQL